MIGPGSILSDFGLVREIGRGGMGVVYLAHQRSLGRNVAVKLLPPERARSPQVAQRFAAEARKMAQLSHRGIAQVFIVGEQQGTRYFAMQYLPGGSLESRLRQGPLTVEQAVEVAAQVAEALDYAHAQGLVHRDIKPANIMFDADGRAVVTDFGIARAGEDVHLTATGTAIGTPHYMAPEQARGAVLDGRADIYALGVALYEMVCGRPPFDGETPLSIAVQHLGDTPTPPRVLCPDVPEWLQGIILKALAKDPAHRFATAGEMAQALRTHQTVRLTRTPALQWSGPSPLMITALAAAVVGVVVILAVLLWPSKTSEAPPPAPPAQNVIVQDSPAPPDEPTDTSETTPVPTPEETKAVPPPVSPPGASKSGVPPPVAGPPACVEYRDPSLGVRLLRPASWNVRRDSRSEGKVSVPRLHFNETSGGGHILVECSRAPNEVTEEPDAAWRGMDAGFRKDTSRQPYTLIGIRPDSLAGLPGSLLEFTRPSKDGQMMHCVDYGIRRNGAGWALLAEAPSEEWGRYVSLFQQVKNSLIIE